MENSQYYKSENGKLVCVPPLDECLNAIKVRYEDSVKRNEYLLEENKKLKDEHYRDDEIQRLKNALTKLDGDLRRGFTVTEDEEKRIDAWAKEHDEKVHSLKTPEARHKAGGAVGGRFSYTFVPTGIGTIGIVKCSCGEEFIFRELE
jgi:hypothetical protein